MTRVAIALALACAVAGGCSKKDSDRADPKAWPAEAVESFIRGCVEKARPGLDPRTTCTCIAGGLQQRWSYQEFRDFSEKGRDVARMSSQQLADFEAVMTGCVEGK